MLYMTIKKVEVSKSDNLTEFHCHNIAKVVQFRHEKTPCFSRTRRFFTGEAIKLQQLNTAQKRAKNDWQVVLDRDSQFGS